MFWKLKNRKLHTMSLAKQVLSGSRKPFLYILVIALVEKCVANHG
jgi:hypothetical protein